MRRLFLMPVCLCLASASPSWAPAAENRPVTPRIASVEWPQWRGPHRDGVSTETGLLDAWPDEGPPLLWTASNLGAGFSSLSISGGRIFTMGDRADGEYVISLDLEDGHELWSKRIGEIWSPQGYPGPRCTPSVDGDRVYALGPHGDLVCLRANNGDEVWHRNLTKDFQGKMHSWWGFSESPLIDGDRLLCTPGGPEAAIVALDKKTGSEIWRTKLPDIGPNGSDGAGYSSIVISNGAGVKQYVQLLGRGVVGVDAKDGRFLWGYNRVANHTANIPTPLVRDDYVFCATGYGTGSALLKLKGTKEGLDAEELYFLNGKELQNHHGGLVMVGDYIYCGHGHKAGAPTCLDWKTGKIVWRENRGPGNGSAAVAYADGNLYVRYEDGVMALIGASPDKYQLKGTFKIPDCEAPSWSHPVIAGGKLYLREQDALLCYDITKHK